MSSTNLEYTDKILQGDVIEQLQKLPGEFVDCVVTSPPYWGLRDYGVEGQIGLEEQPKEYINKIVSVFDEIKRVLKPTGTVFLNIGDTYYGAMRFTAKYASGIINQWRPDTPLRKNLPKTNWLQPKQKLLIPERIAIEMQEHGWILRNHIIWFKPNHLPSSAQDRLTGSYESVFFFVKNPDYYFNLNAIRKPAANATVVRQNYVHNGGKSGQEAVSRPRKPGEFANPLGVNPGDVWQINTEPSYEAHIAMFPTKLVKQCLKCGCPKDGLVLDPFTGSGTTLVTARKLSLHYLGIEIKPEYVEIAKKRLTAIPERLETFLQPNPLLASMGGS